MKLRKISLHKIDITYRIFFNGSIENIFRKSVIAAEMNINTSTNTYQRKKSTRLGNYGTKTKGLVVVKMSM
jgi:hypothetical protein